VPIGRLGVSVVIDFSQIRLFQPNAENVAQACE
jgi:hypothetical protein